MLLKYKLEMNVIIDQDSEAVVSWCARLTEFDDVWGLNG